jgi:hypothetical protein
VDRRGVCHDWLEVRAKASHRRRGLPETRVGDGNRSRHLAVHHGNRLTDPDVRRPANLGDLRKGVGAKGGNPDIEK